MSPIAVPGAVIAGRYRLESIVGKGGMGAVWSATHLGLHRVVAVKIISSDFARSHDLRARFDTEAKAAAKLQSRHVVQIYDNGELADGTPFIAMELLQGESLQTRLVHGGPVSLAETVQVVSQVARALGRAHAAGIVHRDIKPDNIFLAQSEEDGGIVVKVLDFGVAKFSIADETQSTTRTGALVGTPLFMSPEQARGLKTIDGRTDLYSLGLVAYTMLTGRQAFTGESFGDLLLQICTRSLPSLVTYRPDVPPAVEAWFIRTCARDPDARFPTAQDLVDALVAASGGVAPPLHLSAPSLPHAAVASPAASISAPGVQHISAAEAHALGSQPTYAAPTLPAHQTVGGTASGTLPGARSGSGPKTALLVFGAATVAAIVAAAVTVLIDARSPRNAAPVAPPLSAPLPMAASATIAPSATPSATTAAAPSASAVPSTSATPSTTADPKKLAPTHAVAPSAPPPPRPVDSGPKRDITLTR